MKGLKSAIVVMMAFAVFAVAMPTEQAAAQYGFGGFRQPAGFGFGFRGLIRNRVIQNNLNQQALRQIAIQNSFRRNNFVAVNNGGFAGSFNNGAVRVNVNSGFGNNFNFQNNGIIPGHTQFVVNGRLATVAVDNQSGTFVSVNGVLVRVR